MDHSLAYVRTEDAPMLKPPANLVGVRGWVMANLFPNWSNSILTIVAALFAYWVLSNVLGWALFRATWTGENRDACAVEGAGRAGLSCRPNSPNGFTASTPSTRGGG